MGIREELQQQWRTGGVLFRLIMINAGVFLVLRLVDLLFWMFGQEGPFLAQWLQSGSSFSYLLHRPWTVLTYMFIHWGLGHIFFNMLILWFLGRMFQDLLGERRLLGNYILGGFTGLAFYVLAYNFVPVFARYADGSTIMGASAGVMAVFIGLAAYRPDLEVHLLLFGAVKLKWLALIYVLIDLVMIREGGNSGGHIAHLGGAAYGYFAGRQLTKGNDWSLSFVNGVDGLLKRVFGKRGPRMRVAHGGKGARNKAAREKISDQARIDAILDKIGRSGYDSLTKAERDILFRASNER